MDLHNNNVYLGDVRRIGKHVLSNSVDIIITDPPYLREYLPLYGWLARFALRVLKEGSYLIAYGPGMFMPEVFKHMTVKGLDFFWMEPLLHNGGWPRIRKFNLASGYKPIFIYTKGKPLLTPFRGTIHSDRMDKKYHKWGQGVGLTKYFLELLTNPWELVLDPFAGGGNVLAGANALGRDWLGFEKDKEQFKILKKRMESEQPPLFPAHRQERQLLMNLSWEEIADIEDIEEGITE